MKRRRGTEGEAGGEEGGGGDASFLSTSSVSMCAGSETDTLSHRKRWGWRRPLKVNKARGFKGRKEKKAKRG